MDYHRIYREFIADRKSKPKPDCYTERHHIVPRSLGGGNDAKNLIDLTAEDHLFAHVLLARVYGGTMWTPVLAAFGQWARDRLPTAREIRLQALARRKSREAMQGGGNPFFGKSHSAETISILRDQKVYEFKSFSGGSVSGTRHEIAEVTGLSVSRIASVLNGGKFSAGDWYWPETNPEGLTGGERISQAIASDELLRLFHADGREWSGTRRDFADHFGQKFFIQPGSHHCFGWHLDPIDAARLSDRTKRRAITASQARGDISGRNNPMAGSDRRKDELVRLSHKDGATFEGSLKSFADERGIDALTYGRMRKTLLGKKVVNGQIVKSFWGWSLAS